MDWREVNLTHAYYNGSHTSKDIEDQDGVQVSRPEDAEYIFSIGSALEDIYIVVFVLGRNIIIMAPKQMSQAAIAKLVSDEVAKALAADRATRNATGAGNGWIEWDVPLREMDEPMVDSESDEEETDDEDDDGNVVDEPKSSIYDVGGSVDEEDGGGRVMSRAIIVLHLVDPPMSDMLWRSSTRPADALHESRSKNRHGHAQIAMGSFVLYTETVVPVSGPFVLPGVLLLDQVVTKIRNVVQLTFRIMAPKQMSQAAIAKLVADEVKKALDADRATRNTTGAGGPGNVEGAGNAGGPERAQRARDCTFS
ncbi:hypothetical protein Tco_0943996, partial [Tanacetum coccineum]